MKRKRRFSIQFGRPLIRANPVGIVLIVLVILGAVVAWIRQLLSAF